MDDAAAAAIQRQGYQRQAAGLQLVGLERLLHLGRQRAADLGGGEGKSDGKQERSDDETAERSDHWHGPRQKKGEKRCGYRCFAAHYAPSMQAWGLEQPIARALFLNGRAARAATC
ncbi:hypothetical protein OH686_03100 [Pseudomonas sp. SO81]|nr:hypothetical protein OH686_03100 [Pseudomonas sp. SO81]